MLDDDSLVRFDDDGGAIDLVSRRKLVARIDQRSVPFAAGEEARAPCRLRQFRALGLACRFAKRRAPADRFDRDGLDHQVLFAVDEAELRLVRTLERGFHSLQRDQFDLAARRRTQTAGTDDQRRIGAGVADMRAHMHGDLVFRDAWPVTSATVSRASRRATVSSVSHACLPNGSSIACWRTLRISARPMP